VEKTFVNPNLHVALVHFPLALLISGTLIELFSFMWRRHGFRAAGRWMILLGALSSIPTALAGVYALNDVARMGDVPEAGSWREVAANSKLTIQQWHFLKDHTWLQSEATLLAVFVVVLWIACSDLWRRRLHLPLLVLLLVAVGLTVSGAWHGGEAVYRLGTAVLPYMEGSTIPNAGTTHGPKPFAVPTTNAAAAAVAAAAATSEPTTNVVATTTGAAEPASAGAVEPREDKSAGATIQYYVPPLQTHLVLAGSTVAIALAALGLSIRKITQEPPVTQVDHIAAALGGPATLIGGEADDFGGAGGAEHLPPAASADPIDVAAPRVPASRFWLLATLLGLATAACGAWVLANLCKTWSAKDLWQFVADRDQNGGAMITRRLAHVIAGVSITVIPIFLAGLARWTPRQKWLLTIFTVLLVAAIAAQVWLGVLMLYDGTQGSVRAFN
jgi:uncharacterized membrane protein